MITNGTLRKIAVFSALALIASGTAFACGGSTCPCETLIDAISQISTAEAQRADAQSALSARLQMLGDQDFLQVAMEDSAAKVLLGQVALKNSQRSDLKQFALQVIQDQIALSQQVLERVGRPLGVHEEKELSKKDKLAVSRLAALSGTQFDEEYVKIMLKDQKQEMKKFGDETRLAVDPRVKIAAEYDQKLASQHLESLQKIAEGGNLVAENQRAASGAK